MATLQKIRDRGTLLVIILGIALLAFVLGDLFTSGTTLFGKAQDRAFVVNGEVVSTQEYVNRITEWEDFQKMVSGQTSLDENASMQIREAVYQQMVRERILNNQAKKLGLAVSKEEINDLVHGTTISPLLQQLPFFVDPQTGMFDRNSLVEFLSAINKPADTSRPEEQAIINQYKSIWLFIENMIKYQRLEEKYVSLLSHAMMPNDVEAKTSFDLSQQNADISYVMQSYFSLPDSAVTVTDNEIKSFYDKNKDAFKLDAPLVKLSYFAKEITPSDEDFAEVESQAQMAFTQLQAAENPAPIVSEYSEIPYRDVFISESVLSPSQVEFARSAAPGEMFGPVRDGDSFQVLKMISKTTAPDSVHLRMMAIPDASMMEQDSVVTHFVDSLYNEIQQGRSFAEVANSLNPQSNGGDVGWAREIDLIGLNADVAKMAFSASIGQAMKLRVPGQQIILQVEERTAPVQKYKMAIIDMPVIASEKTSNNIDNELNQFVSNPDASAKFNELAAEKGYMAMPNTTVSANDFMLGQIPNSRQIISWAVNEKGKNAVRKFDLTNLRVVARVDGIVPAGTAPLSEVSTGIRARLVNEKKADKIISELTAKNLTSLDTYASTMNAVVDTVKYVNYTTQNISGLGYEPTLNAVAAFAPLNTIVGPLKGNMGVYVTKVTDRTQGTEPYDADLQKRSMLNERAYRMQMQAVEVLKQKMGVQDNRYKFF